MKRTTLALDEDLLRRLKERAAREGRTLQAVANELLRNALREPQRDEAYELHIEGWDGELLPGVDLFDRDQLFDIMDQG